MSFNYQREFDRLKKKLDAEAQFLLEAGFSLAQIEELHKHDWDFFKLTRRYYSHRMNLCDCIQTGKEDNHDGGLEFMDMIENDDLFFSCKEMTDAERSLISLYHLSNYTQKEIAYHLGQTPMNVCKKIKRIDQKIAKAVQKDNGDMPNG